MKRLPLISCFLFLAHYSIAQTSGVDKQGLLDYIRKSDHVATYCGWSQCECIRFPVLFLKQDSLFRNSSLDEIKDYFNDTSYVLKSYAFYAALYRDETCAFELLSKSINDSTIVTLSDHRWRIAFNKLLLQDYLVFIKFKYLVGGSGTATVGIKRISFQFGRPDRKVYNEKLRQVSELLNGAYKGILLT